MDANLSAVFIATSNDGSPKSLFGAMTSGKGSFAYFSSKKSRLPSRAKPILKRRKDIKYRLDTGMRQYDDRNTGFPHARE